MTTPPLAYRFSQALRWNAFSYAIYKLLFVTLTYALYHTLDTASFSLWANINSIVYLVVLWTDCGLSKSVPRFVPVFAQHPSAYRSFITTILATKSLILALALAPTLWYLHTFHTTSITMLALATGIFMTQGIVSIIQTIYHAHFWNKQFNTISTVCMALSMLASVIIAFAGHGPVFIIMSIFLVTIIANSMVIIITLMKMPAVTRDMPISLSGLINVPHEKRQFAIHTVMMGISTMLKSLTERNFLLPFFTLTLGAQVGNIFKVANDSALFFYRIILKTIGSADTALLSHVVVQQETKSALQDATKKLTTKIAALLFPVLGIIIIGMIIGSHLKNDQYVFHLFIIMVIAYSLETLLLAYERVLEVRLDYRHLIYAYVPYLIMITLLITTHLITLLPFVITIALIHGVRLVSLGLMVYYAYRVYHVSVRISLPRYAFNGVGFFKWLRK